MHPPTQLELALGETLFYRIEGAYCRTQAEAERCPPRSLLRVYWPLQSS